MSELDKAIDNFFGGAKKITLKTLFEEVEKALDLFDLQGLDEDRVGFRIPPRSNKQGKKFTATIQMIPDLEVSELGWANAGTPTGEGSEYAGNERALLEGYLNNIGTPGGIDTLGAKLAELSDLADRPEAYIDGIEGSGADKLKRVVSFLVFYKTLTKIVANFNAASAGFSFEAFMATLLNGSQIPAAGAATIADFMDSDENYISLKLYAEGSVEVGGSFDALVGDLIDDNKNNTMTYLVVTKDLSGQRGTLKGSLKFYRFDFTLDNVMNILYRGKAHSSRCIILPFIQPDAGLPEDRPEMASKEDIKASPKIRVIAQDVQTAFIEKLGSDLDKSFIDGILPKPESSEKVISQVGRDAGEEAPANLPSQEPNDPIRESPGKNLAQQIGKAEHFVYLSDSFIEIGTGTGLFRDYPSMRGSGPKKSAMLQILKDIPFLKSISDVDLKNQYAVLIARHMRAALKDALAVLEAARGARRAEVAKITQFQQFSWPTEKDKKTKDPRGGTVAQQKLLSIQKAAKRSAIYYNALETPEEKKKALLLTYGYINDKQFSMNRTEVIHLAGTEAPGATEDTRLPVRGIDDPTHTGYAKFIPPKPDPEPEPSVDAPLNEAAAAPGSELGVLEIGYEALQKLLNSCIESLNQNMFSVFSDLQDLSNHLNSLFAGGVEDTGEGGVADKAIYKAGRIQRGVQKEK